MSYSEDLLNDEPKYRRLFLNCDVDSNLFTTIGQHILRFNREDKDIPVDKREPIKLYIMSNGGTVIDGLTLINIILASATPIYTITFGQEYSMAFYIGICGTKRFGAPLSSYLIHDGSISINHTWNKTNDMLDFNKLLFEKMEKIIITHTNIVQEELDKKSREEWYILAPQAKELGIIDCIIGEDCNISEVV